MKTLYEARKDLEDEIDKAFVEKLVIPILNWLVRFLEWISKETK
jgi:hypothetical protein